MEFKIKDVSAFKSLLANHKKITQSHGKYLSHILSAALIEASKTKISVTSTSDDVQLTESLSASSETPGKCAVLCGMLADVVATASDDTEISFEVKNSKAHVHFDDAYFEIPVFKVDDYPSHWHLKKGSDMNRADICEAVRRCIPACNSKDLSVVMSGIKIEQHDDAMRLVSTDSYRLHMMSLPLEDELPFADMVISLPFAREFLILASRQDEETVLCAADDTCITVSMDGKKLTGKLKVDSDYPAYEKLLSHPDHKLQIKVDSECADALLFAIRQGVIVAREAYTQLTFTPKGIQVTMTDERGGQLEKFVDCPSSVKKFKLLFNPKYLQEALESVDEPMKFVMIEDEQAPKPVFLEGESGRRTALIMPLRG